MRRLGMGRQTTRVLVCSSGGVRNAGDDAILLRTAERIRAAEPKTRIDVLTDEGRSLPAARGMRVLGVLSDHTEVDLRAYALVIVAGGGYACDWFGANLAPRRRIASRAVDAGVPVVITGQGIGPLTDARIADDLDALVAATRFVSVRDELSCDLLTERGFDATVTGDDALGLNGTGDAGAGHVVVHLRDAWYHTDDRDVLDAWARASSDLARTRATDVVGLAVNDRPEAPESATLRAAGIARVVDAASDPRLLVAHVARASGVIAHSYHVALFALAAGTPAVLAATSPYYAQKAEGLRRLAEVSDAFVASEPPTAAALAERLDAVGADLEHNNALARAAARVDAAFTRQWAEAAGKPRP